MPPRAHAARCSCHESPRFLQAPAIDVHHAAKVFFFVFRVAAQATPSICCPESVFFATPPRFSARDRESLSEPAIRQPAWRKNRQHSAPAPQRHSRAAARPDADADRHTRAALTPRLNTDFAERHSPAQRLSWLRVGWQKMPSFHAVPSKGPPLLQARVLKATGTAEGRGE